MVTSAENQSIMAHNFKSGNNLKFDFFFNTISFVLSLADVDAELLMEEESLVWTSKDVVIVLEHKNEKIPLRYVKVSARRIF